MTTREEIEIRARDKTKGFASVTGGLRHIGRQALNAKTALLSLAGIGGLGILLKNSAANVDQITKLADRLGIATDALAGIKLQAKLSGVEFATVTTGLRTVQYATYQATLGLQTYTRAFDALNLNAKDFARLAPEQQLRTLIDRLAKIPNITERNAVAYQIFGGRASQLLNLINDGTAALDRSTEQARAWGLALNRVDSAKIEMMNDAMTRAKSASEGLANTINVALAPYIAAIAENFASAAESSNGFRDQVRSGMQIAAKAIGFAADAVQLLQGVWKGLELGIAKIIDFIIQRQNDLVQLTLGNYNKLAESSLGKKLGLPMVEFANTMDMVADVSANRVTEIAGELRKLWKQPWAHKAVNALFANVTEKAQALAETVARTRAKLQAGIGQGLQLDNSGAVQAQFDEMYRRRLATIEESLKTEAQKLQDSLTQQQSIIEGAQALRINGEVNFQNLLDGVQRDHALKRAQLEIQMAQHVRNAQISVFQEISGLLQNWAGENRTAAIAVIAIQKGLAIAQTIMNTQGAAIRALFELGPIAGPPAAARIEALGHAAVAIIAAQGLAEVSHLGSSGAGVGTPANPVVTQPAASFNPVPANSGPSQVNVTLIVQADTVVGSGGMQEFTDRHLVPALKTSFNRDTVIIERNSRQARELKTP